MKYICIFGFYSMLFLNNSLSAQQVKKSLTAKFIHQNIILDGKLDEEEWKDADKTTTFTQFAPNPGLYSSQKTAVAILYDNSSIYVGVQLYDKHPDSILKQLSVRDDYAENNDLFGVGFDTYNDNQNATVFFVTAAGVQADGIQKFDGLDLSWNAPWYSKVTFNDSGWCVEMKIPYSALRFPKKSIQEWGVNFERVIRRNRENSYWSIVKPEVTNVLSQEGVLTGIHDIVSPIRLSLLPYISGYAQNTAGINTHSIDGGADIKYGINESFTLDMTLIPDFGQTVYDNKVLNLSPVEVRYVDNRYFFTEGLSLFNKNDLFYTRRVGGTPVNYNNVNNLLDTNENIKTNPSITNLYNAVKISGRNTNNLGIGFFNAVSAPTSAVVTDTITNKNRSILTSPLTNYNVIVLDQVLKNNSYISFINTDVMRSQGSYNANVSAILLRLANKSNTYGIDASSDLSQIIYAKNDNIGQRYNFDINKWSGNYTWTLQTRGISDNFNPNDLGYLARNNIVNYILNQNYAIYKPWWIFNSCSSFLSITYNRIFNPDAFYSLDFFGSETGTFKNYLSMGIQWDLAPLKTYDYFEPRTLGRFYIFPENRSFSSWISSDYRKKFALDIYIDYTLFSNINYPNLSEKGRNTLIYSISPRIRFSDRILMVYSFSKTYSQNDVGFVENDNGNIYLGIRNLTTITNSLNTSYIFTNIMSLSLSARHYWSQANYSNYALLGSDGSLNPTTYNTNNNINYNAFNVYLSFVWQYLPGSEMSLVYQNSIYTSGTSINNNYYGNLNNTISSPQTNNLSIKIIYYLDYLSVKNAFKKMG